MINQFGEDEPELAFEDEEACPSCGVYSDEEHDEDCEWDTLPFDLEIDTDEEETAS